MLFCACVYMTYKYESGDCDMIRDMQINRYDDEKLNIKL